MGVRANELRIGNFILDEGQIIKITAHSFNALYFQVCSGIPLTPKILEACGFINEFDNYYSNKTMVRNSDFKTFHFALFYHTEQSYHTSDALHRSNATPLKYLHQLQNRYYSLCGEELQVNLKEKALT